MNFDDKLRELINQADVPDELMPENIAEMLKSRSSKIKMGAEHRDIIFASQMSSANKRRAGIMRIAATCAACAVLVVGVWVYTDKNSDPVKIEDPIDYEAVTPKNYDDLYNLYTGIYLDDSGENDTDSTEKTADSGTQVSGGSAAGVINDDGSLPTEPIEPATTDTESYAYSSDYSAPQADGTSDADIVKSDDQCIYYILNNSVYISSLDTMEVTAKIEKNDNSPFEMYIEGNKLILISKETEKVAQNSSGSGNAANTENVPNASDNATVSAVPAEDTDINTESNEIDTDNSNYDVSGSDTRTSETGGEAGNAKNSAFSDDSTKISRTNIAVEIYDISDKSNPKLITSYKQNGDYTSSQMADGILYMVTNYSNYRMKPLEKEADLDSYVPAYYIDKEKYYVAAEDIIIPPDTDSTDYTVVSAIDCNASEITPSVKAVLGINENVYCSADTLYLSGSAKGEKKHTTIVSFDLADGKITKKAIASIEGTIFSGSGMNQYNDTLRVAVKIYDENGTKSAAVYMLDSSLVVTDSTKQLLEGKNVTGVKFSENYVSLMVNDEKTAALILDLTSTAPAQAKSLMKSSSAYICAYGDSKLLGLGIEYSEEGVQTGLSLSMFDTDTGLLINSVVFADDTQDAKSKALTDRRALLVDYDKGIIAVPVYSHDDFGTKNQYYVYSYDDSVGFTVKGIIEYNDIDDSNLFERAVIQDDIFYAVAKGRIVTAQLTDLKVIDSYTF